MRASWHYNSMAPCGRMLSFSQQLCHLHSSIAVELWIRCCATSGNFTCYCFCWRPIAPPPPQYSHAYWICSVLFTVSDSHETENRETWLDNDIKNVHHPFYQPHWCRRRYNIIINKCVANLLNSLIVPGYKVSESV